MEISVFFVVMVAMSMMMGMMCRASVWAAITPGKKR